MERLRQKANKTAKILLICLMAGLGACSEDKPQIENLTVVKDDLPLANIKQAEILEKVGNIISESEKVNSAACEWKYKLIMQYENGMNSTWLYCEEGYMAVFSKRLYPIYKISNVEEFNSLILN